VGQLTKDKSLTLPGLFTRCATAGTKGERVFFSTYDMVYRYALTVLMYYWCLVTSPVAFTYYTFKHHLLWYGTFQGLVLFCFLPIMPIGIALLVCCQRVKGLFVKDWMMEGPGRVFFVKPKGFFAAFLWDCFLNQSMFIGQFLLAGSSDDAIQHTWQDAILTKDYWRSALTKVGARLPKELGRWTGEKVEWFYPLGTADVVVKLPDAYLGIGDSFWNHGKDYKTQGDLEKRMKEEYDGKEALVLELVRPKKDMGVHSIDIITMRTPDDKVQVLSVLLWTDCTTDSSHSCQAGYTVDVETEKIIAPTAWYSPAFVQQKSDMVGQVVPGTKKAVEQAVAAHKLLNEKWLVAVGWDCMIQESGSIFFEGNFAGARTPRRMFLSAATLKEFVCNYFWPFGTGTSTRPGRQAFGGPLESLGLSDFLSFGLKTEKNAERNTSMTARQRSTTM